MAVSLALAAGLLGACTSEPAATKTDEVVAYHATYSSYGTVDDLLSTADLVVRGTPTAARTEQIFMDAPSGNDPNTNPQAGLSSKERDEVRKESGIVVTVSTVKVLEVVKGDVTVGDTIEVSQLGGSFEGVQYQDDGTTLLSKDGEYVLFLAAKDA
ncbi:MAG TPA: hypothetical protein VFO77_16070, partial [Actinoplanes sp.]|nr:hypothetical protein [Actinoplanes sp.]